MKLAGRETDAATPRERYEAHRETTEASTKGRKPTGLKPDELWPWEHRKVKKQASLREAYVAGVRHALKLAFQQPLPVPNAVNTTRLQSYPDINQRQNISAPPAGGNVPGSQPASTSTQTAASEPPKLAAPLSMDVKDITRRKTTPKGVPGAKKTKTAAEGPEPAVQSAFKPAGSSKPFSSVPPALRQPGGAEPVHTVGLAPALAAPAPTPPPLTNPEQLSRVESTRRVPDGTQLEQRDGGRKKQAEDAKRIKPFPEGAGLLPADPEAAEKVRKETLRRMEEKAAGPKTNMAKNTAVGLV